MKSASEIIPEVMRRIVNPVKPRPVPVGDEFEKIRQYFKFEIYDSPPGWEDGSAFSDGRRRNPTRPQLTRMLIAAHNFIEDIREGKPPRWLSLLGGSGAGKTYLADRIWRWYKNSKHFQPSIGDDIVYPGTFFNWSRFANRLSQNEGRAELDDYMEEKLVVADEIGADRDKSGFVRDCLAKLCSARVNKWTILTCNMSLGDIERNMDVRIASRMLRDGSEVVDVELPDFNLRSR